jgi:2,3-dihydroxybenzoate-AMP ligase
MMKPDHVVPWPADIARAYRAAGCWNGRPLGCYVWEWAEQRGDRVALTDRGDQLTYLDLAVKADCLAVGFAELGLNPGDTVLLQLPNCWEFVVVTLACFRLGVVPVMMLPQHREHELTSIGAHVGARALIVPGLWRGYDHQDLACRVAGMLPEAARVMVMDENVRRGCVDLRGMLGGEGDSGARRRWLDERAPESSSVALFLLSGGTTGVPKVISRTHDDYAYCIDRTAAACGFGPDTVYLAALPISHNFALGCPGVFGALFSGGRAVLVPTPAPEGVFEAIEAQRVTVTSAVPAVVLKWMEAVGSTRHDVSSLRSVQVGGSVLPPETAARIGPALGCRLQQAYGMAEGLICYTPSGAPEEVAHFTQGVPVSEFDELLVVDQAGRPVPAGEIGELLTRGPYTPRGYYGVPAQNKISFTPDGWFRTGDLVRITHDGYVVVCGRVKDLINRGGEKISAAEIEAVLDEMPEVAEVAAVAMPDPAVGERVCVFIRLLPGCALTLDGITAYFASRGVAQFKVPEHMVIMDAMPYTPVGKADKKALRALLPIAG